MPAPSASLSTLRPDLAGSLMEFNLAMRGAGFIANRVAPVFEAATPSGSYGLIPIEQLLKIGDTKRANGSGYNRGSWTFTKGTFACDEHGWEEPVDDRARRMYRNYFDAELIAAQRARNMVMQNYEIRVAALLFNATTFTSYTSAVTTEWSTGASATPVDDVQTAKSAVRLQCGMRPNALIICRTVFDNLRQCDQVMDRIAAQGAGTGIKQADVTQALMAQVFDLEEVIVAEEIKDSALEGQDVSLAEIWDDEYAMVARIGRNPNDFQDPGVARTIHWSEDGSQIGAVIESYRDEAARSDIIRARMDSDEIVPYVEAGYLLSNITA